MREQTIALQVRSQYFVLAGQVGRGLDGFLKVECDKLGVVYVNVLMFPIV